MSAISHGWHVSIIDDVITISHNIFPHRRASSGLWIMPLCAAAATHGRIDEVQAELKHQISAIFVVVFSLFHLCVGGGGATENT